MMTPRIFLLFVICASYIALSEQVCQQVLGRGVSSQDISTIVNKHNDLRRRLTNGQVPNQPKATNMKQMKWDNKLASEAQKIANTCEFKHVKVSDPRWKIGVGQNLYTSYSSSNSGGSDWNGAIQSWFDEVKSYKYPGGFSMATGHYTQVAWADTEYVGCGWTFYKDNSKPKYPYTKLYVCNYGPAGNVNGQPPYKTG